MSENKTKKNGFTDQERLVIFRTIEEARLGRKPGRTKRPKKDY